MGKYNDMKEFYDKRIVELTEERDHYRERYIQQCREYREFERRQIGKHNKVLDNYHAALGKIEMYKEFLNRLYGEHSLTTDTMFIFEGKQYRPTEFDLHREKGEPDRLTVEFVAIPMDI